MLSLFAQWCWAAPGSETCNGRNAASVISVQGAIEEYKVNTSQWRSLQLNDTICQGSQIRAGKISRASVVLPNGIVAHIDAGTVLTFKDIETDKPTLLELLEGFIHFISRTPKQLQINTPIANAGPEGTEFAISANTKSASVWVYEGSVKFFNKHGSLRLKPGEGAQAYPNRAPQARIDIKPEDAVNWALYYPPLIPYASTDGTTNSTINSAIRAFRRGRIEQAATLLESVPEARRTVYFYKVRAAFLITLGQIDSAKADIKRLLKQNQSDAEALAYLAVIAIVQNRKDEALALAKRAVAANPESAVAYSALSYAEQGRFNLEAALDSVSRATKLTPDDAMLWARKAELELALGLPADSAESVRRAEQLDANLERTQTVIGFSRLRHMNTDTARAAFEQAVALDSTAPLARLGLGLAKIRSGDLAEGRKDLEFAAILDPNNALIRSYLGKTYYEERRNSLAEDQFRLAKERDPKDPTPYFYDALRKQAENRPIGALQDMQKAVALNDNRGVYRSKLLLDQDAAARTANLARIYIDLGFGRVALKEAWNSLNYDNANPSAHRFLSDAYIGQTRYRAARASELLQAQLLQPLNITPVQPQLTAENIGILNSTGPGNLSVNEYDPLFNANGAHIVLNGAYGSRNTKTDNAIISGIYNKLSGSLGQFHYETEGFRENDRYQEDIYDAFAQYAFSPDLNGQIELKSSDIRAGDVPFRLNGEIKNRQKFNQAIGQDSIRVGGHLKLTAKQDLIGSFIRSTLKDVTNDQKTNQNFPIFTDHATRTETIKTYQAEIQHLFSGDSYSLVSGLSMASYIDRQESIVRLFIDDFLVPSPPQKANLNNDGAFYNGYFYLKNRLFDALTATLGLSVDSFESQLFDRQQIDPKFGLVWNPIQPLVLRGAVFRTLKRPLSTNQTIEPTQIAGFNQFFDEFNGTSAWQYSFGADYRIVDSLFVGGEVSWRKGLRPNIETANDGELINKLQHFNQSNHLAYLYWTYADWLALKAEYHIDNIDRSFNSTEEDATSPIDLSTQQVPLSIHFFHPTGVFARLAGTYVDQSLFGFSDELGQLGKLSEQFWTFDAAIGYRLPRRLGVVSFEMRNMFDNHYRFQSAFDSSGPQLSPYVPERQLFAKLSIFY